MACSKSPPMIGIRWLGRMLNKSCQIHGNFEEQPYCNSQINCCILDDNEVTFSEGPSHQCLLVWPRGAAYMHCRSQLYGHGGAPQLPDTIFPDLPTDHCCWQMLWYPMSMLGHSRCLQGGRWHVTMLWTTEGSFQDCCEIVRSSLLSAAGDASIQDSSAACRSHMIMYAGCCKLHDNRAASGRSAATPQLARLKFGPRKFECIKGHVCNHNLLRCATP